MKIYIRDKQALAFFSQQASSEFWDRHWEIEELRSYILAKKSDRLFMPAIKTYLPPGSMVLEGGCGRGQLVYALHSQGYRAIGLDFAEKTIQNIKDAVPELDIRYGDVRELPFDNDTFDGYLSAGVIEHFWEGYTPILEEMQRTIKPGGFLFISFPYLSPLRRLKMHIGGYSCKLSQEIGIEEQNTFYQFALNWRQVVRDFERLGFTFVTLNPYDGIGGFQREIPWFQTWLKAVYEGKKHKRIKRYLERFLRVFAAHVVMVVLQKR